MSKKIIYGDTVGTPMARPDWAEENERSASYIKNKPTEEIKANTEARHEHENKNVLDGLINEGYNLYFDKKRKYQIYTSRQGALIKSVTHEGTSTTMEICDNETSESIVIKEPSTQISQLENDSGFITMEDVIESNIGLTEQQEANLVANTKARHTHDNKDVLDSITEDLLNKISSYKPILYIGGTNLTPSLNSERYTVFTSPIIKLSILSLLNTSHPDTIPEYVCVFTTSNLTIPRFSLPRDVQWANNDIPEIKMNCKYIIRIFDNIATYSEVSL